jgi:hypothetical protein
MWQRIMGWRWKRQSAGKLCCTPAYSTLILLQVSGVSRGEMGPMGHL